MLGENLKRARDAKGLSQEALAEQLHVVRQTVSKWEQGLSVPDAEMLKRIAEICGVTMQDLLDEKIVTQKSVDDLAVQLALLNAHFDNQEKRRKKAKKILVAVLSVIISVIVVLMILVVTSIMWFTATPSEDTVTVQTDVVEMLNE